MLSRWWRRGRNWWSRRCLSWSVRSLRLLDFQTPAEINVFAQTQAHQRLQCGFDHIRGVLGTKGLCQDVFDACRFKNRTHCLARNNTRARRSRSQEDFCSAIMRKHLMRNSGIFQRHPDHLRTGHFSALANRIRDFAGFTQTDSHTAVLVSHDDQRAEIEAAPAFDDFGGTIDEHDLFAELLPGLRIISGLGLRPASPPTAWSACRAVFTALYFGWFGHSIGFHYTLELQTRFARCISQGFHLAMITRTAAVKNHLFDSLAQGGLCRQTAKDLGAHGIGGQLIPVRRRLARC